MFKKCRCPGKIESVEFNTPQTRCMGKSIVRKEKVRAMCEIRAVGERQLLEMGCRLRESGEDVAKSIKLATV